MSTELHDLLDRGVPDDVADPDVSWLLARGRRRHRAKRIGAGAAAVVVLLSGGVVVGDLVAGGRAPVVGEAPGTDVAWEPISDAPLTPREQPATATDGDRVLFWGGATGEPHAATSDGTTSHGTVHLQDGAIYDRGEDAWTPVPPAPGLSLRDVQDVSLAGDAVLVWGGVPLEPVGDGGVYGDWNGAPLMDGAVYDVAASTWTRVPPAPLPPRSPAVVHWDGTELLVWGGEAATGEAVADGARWTAEDGWRPMADFPLSPRLGAAIAWDDDRLVVWGGGTNLDPAEGEGEEELVADGAVYDRVADMWTELPPGPLSPRWFSYHLRSQTALLDEYRVLVAGGATTSPLTQFHDGAWLDLDDRTWREIAAAPDSARFVTTDGVGATAIDDGDGVLWLYDTTTDRWDRVETGQRINDSITTPWGRVLYDQAVGFPDADGVWRPVTLVEPNGVTRRPALDDVRGSDSRSFHAVVPVDGGLVLWGGMTQQTRGEAITGGDWTATGWFLPDP